MNVSPYAFPGIPELHEHGITPKNVTDHVCREFRIGKKEIKASTRKPEVVQARQIACYLLRGMCLMTYERVGREICRDHTTVMHSIETVNDLMDSDPGYKARVDKLKLAIIRAVRTERTKD